MKLQAGNAAYTFLSRNGNNTFNTYFVAFYPVRDVLLHHGRPVCSTDMGHFKHQLFDGMNATGTSTSLFPYLQNIRRCFDYWSSAKRTRLLLSLTNRLVPDG
jgi:hypothetical protein